MLSGNPMASNAVDRQAAGRPPVLEATGLVRRGDLETAVELTREMLAMAEAGAWDELYLLEPRRAALITRHFSASRMAGTGGEEGACLRELRDLNDRILEIGAAERQRLLDALSDSQRQRDAASHYHRLARFG